MAIESGEAFRQRMEQSRYDTALPWERLAINFWRWWYREPPLRATPRPPKA